MLLPINLDPYKFQNQSPVIPNTAAQVRRDSLARVPRSFRSASIQIPDSYHFTTDAHSAWGLKTLAILQEGELNSTHAATYHGYGREEGESQDIQ